MPQEGWAQIFFYSEIFFKKDCFCKQLISGKIKILMCMEGMKVNINTLKGLILAGLMLRAK